MQEPLRRVLGTPQLVFIGINGVVGGGIFLLPGQVARLAGAAGVWAYLLAGIVIVLIGLCYAEAGTMFDRTGGPLVYVEEGLGRPAGFTVGWAIWLTYLIGWAVLINGFINYLAALWPAAAPLRGVIAVGGVALLCLINSLGVRLGSAVIQGLAVAKLLPLGVLIIAGLSFAGQPGNATLGLVPAGTGDLFGAVLLVIFAYGGFEAVSIPAGEMANPRRSIVVAVLGTLLGVTVFYVLIQYAALRIAPGLASSTTPLAAAGARMFAGGLTFMTIGALLSIFGTQSGVALTAPRSLYALAREGMLPAGLGAVQRRFETPIVAIWLTGALVALLAVTGTFAQLILLNVAARLYQYLLVCVAVAVLRFRAPGLARPFRLPLGITIPVLAAALCLALLARQPLANLLATAGALVAGLALYFLTRRFSR